MDNIFGMTGRLNHQVQLDTVLHMAKDDMDILAVILFGSAARGEVTAGSDTDVCIVLDQHSNPSVSSAKRLQYLSVADLDIVIFQQLPIYIRHRVIKEGKVLFCRDEDMLYAIALRNAREFEDFRHIYKEYLGEVSLAR
ncbi:MAG: type VII toxin-antitoxin system MntA family adenylyltransferase antitoxin [Dissulfurispiraceae bacterium]